MRTDPNIIITIPIFFWFYYYFSCENAKVSIFGIFYLNSGHWILVPFRWPDSGDHSGVNTGIAQFRGRSEILAGKFRWNSTGIHRNDRNPTGIGGALIRPRYWVKPSKSTTSSHATFMDLMRWGFKPREVVNTSTSSAPIKRLLLINSVLELKTILRYSDNLLRWNNHTSCRHLQGECISGQMGRK